MNANKARWLIGGLSVLALILSVLIGNEIVSGILVVLCAIISIGILYHKLPELSNISADNPKVKTLRFVTVFNVVVLVGLITFGILTEREVIRFTQQSAAFILPILFAVIIMVFGNVAPQIPHNRYTGLRLPWTVNDEETWIVAHRILGYLSWPCGILCLTGIINIKASIYIPIAMLFVWILVPVTFSYIFFCRKWRMKK